MTRLRILFHGPKFRICAVATDDGCDFDEELHRYRRLNPEGYRKLRSLMEQVAQVGIHHHGPHVIRRLENGCLEFKENRGTGRVFAFIDPTQQAIIICASIWEKKGKKQQNEQIQRLYQLRAEYRRLYWSRPLEAWE